MPESPWSTCDLAGSILAAAFVSAALSLQDIAGYDM